jgi:hypothetical protein
MPATHPIENPSQSISNQIDQTFAANFATQSSHSIFTTSISQLIMMLPLRLHHSLQFSKLF